MTSSYLVDIDGERRCASDKSCDDSELHGYVILLVVLMCRCYGTTMLQFAIKRETDFCKSRIGVSVTELLLSLVHCLYKNVYTKTKIPTQEIPCSANDVPKDTPSTIA